MKANLENKSTFRKWKHIPKMKALSENENTFRKNFLKLFKLSLTNSVSQKEPAEGLYQIYFVPITTTYIGCFGWLPQQQQQ